MAKLYFIYSAMNAGKSTALLQVAHNYGEQGRDVVLFTARVDNRYGEGFITSRLGPDTQRKAQTFDENFDFFAYFKSMDRSSRPACVLVDEGQFLQPEQVRQLHRCAHLVSVPVMVYGLRTDFRGEPFQGSTYLLALSDDIKEIKNVCACLRKATMNMRIDEEGNRVIAGPTLQIGGNDRYRQVCAHCFYQCNVRVP